MSIWAVNWALNTDIANTTHKFVLVALSNFADDEDEAWPHVETLAAMVSVSNRTIFRALELEAAGWLSRRPGYTLGAHGGGLRQVNSVFRLNLPETVTRRKGRGSARPAMIGETPSEVRYDTGVVADSPAGPVRERGDESPSGVRYDTGVTADIRCDTGDASGVTPVSLPYKEEPSGRTHLTPLPPEAIDGASSGQVGRSGNLDEDDRAVAADAADLPSTDEPVGESVDADWALMRECLPEAMQTLDGPTVARIAVLLRERIEAGWTPALIHNTLAGNELPREVHRLGGLVVTRLRAIPVEGAPRRKSVPAPKPPVPVSDEGPRFWRAYQVAKKRAQLLGLPDADRPSFWWMTQIGGERSSIPFEVDLETAVRELIAAESTDEHTPTNTLEHA